MAKISDINVNITLNGEIDVERIAEVIRKEVERAGVSVEVEPDHRNFEVGDYVVGTSDDRYGITNTKMKLAKITKVNGNLLEIVVEAHEDPGCAGHDFEVLSKYFRKATDEEIANIKAEKMWAKIGRKPGEFKAGDFVKYKKCFAEVNHVSDLAIRIMVPNGTLPAKPDALTLIAPVESRVDRV